MSCDSNKPFFCSVCNASFDRRNKLEKHTKTEKHLKNMNDLIKRCDKIQLYNKLQICELKCRDLEDRLQKLEGNNIQSQSISSNQTTYNTTYYTNCNINNNITNTNNITININPLGSENWDYLSDDDICRIMKGVNSCIPEMVKTLHFNKMHPENHNIKLPNKKISQMKTFNGESWDTKNKKDVIEGLITNLVDKLETEYGEEFRSNATRFIKELWDKKIGPITDDQKIDKNLRKQVEFSILDGQAELKN